MAAGNFAGSSPLCRTDACDLVPQVTSYRWGLGAVSRILLRTLNLVESSHLGLIAAATISHGPTISLGASRDDRELAGVCLAVIVVVVIHIVVFQRITVLIMESADGNTRGFNISITVQDVAYVSRGVAGFRALVSLGNEKAVVAALENERIKGRGSAAGRSYQALARIAALEATSQEGGTTSFSWLALRQC